jgi:hypothetical protein
MEIRVQNANVRDAIYGKVVPSGCSPNGFGRRRVADAVGFPSIIADVRVEPRHAVFGIIESEHPAHRCAFVVS